MQPKTPKWLEDVRASAQLIVDATADSTLEAYEANPILRAAVERHFEIIGEAIKRIAVHDPETASAIGNYPAIIAFRNVLIHGYDLVDHARVWAVAREQLPSLIEQVTRLLP